MANKAEIIYLLLGSNIGDKKANLLRAKKMIAERIGQVQRSSNIYQTQAWGNTELEDFYNQALEVRTYNTPEKTMYLILEIEQEMGRVRSTNQYEARIIDIDILFFGYKVLKTKDLVIPHPKFHERNFAMLPMMDINGDFIHPIFQVAIDELYFESKDNSEVILL
jgi:2-amino-4-hydroxy-6-hydroxymethyldihydropteridine diphosphokinase